MPNDSVGPTQFVFVGSIGIGRDESAVLWLTRAPGEEMEVRGPLAEKLEQLLDAFFREHF